MNTGLYISFMYISDLASNPNPNPTAKVVQVFEN